MLKKRFGASKHKRKPCAHEQKLKVIAGFTKVSNTSATDFRISIFAFATGF